jgi:DUF2950 family protein
MISIFPFASHMHPKRRTMTQHIDKTAIAGRWTLLALVTLCALLAAARSFAAERTFASPQEAADALVQTVKANDRKAMLAILGGDTEKWISSGDAVADKELAQRFVSAYEQKHSISADGDQRATLLIGENEHPFAFPLVKTGERWQFDSVAGKDEVLARRIGENELSVINVMLAIVDAQRDYASEDHNKDGVREYARRFASTAGKKDGLYWPTSASEPPSPLGALVKTAASEGYKKNDKPQPYHGYYFKMLLKQGPNAKGGAMDYIVRNRMIGGFAAVAYPANYANSGVMTFIVNHDGVVYQKDLGPKTAETARAMTRFDPGPGWTVVSQP